MIRQANENDSSRIAEIFVYSMRLNYTPIFHNDDFAFNTLQVVSYAKELIETKKINKCYVYDDGIVKGVILINGQEIEKLYVDSFFTNQKIGDKLIRFAISKFNVNFAYVLEKNVRALEFYQRYGFVITNERLLEEGTPEYLLRIERR